MLEEKAKEARERLKADYAIREEYDRTLNLSKKVIATVEVNTRELNVTMKKENTVLHKKYVRVTSIDDEMSSIPVMQYY